MSSFYYLLYISVNSNIFCFIPLYLYILRRFENYSLDRTVSLLHSAPTRKTSGSCSEGNGEAAEHTAHYLNEEGIAQGEVRLAANTEKSQRSIDSMPLGLSNCSYAILFKCCYSAVFLHSWGVIPYFFLKMVIKYLDDPNPTSSAI